jgi:hypothetical protein
VKRATARCSRPSSDTRISSLRRTPGR